MTIMCFSNITVQRNLRWSNSFYYIGDVYFWCTYPRRIIRLETGWIVTAGDLFCGDAQIFSWLPWLHGSHASLFCVNRIMTAHCQVRNKKIIADSGILVLDALFSTLFRVSVRLQQRKTAVLSLLFPYGLVPIFDASYQTDQAANPYILMARDRL